MVGGAARPLRHAPCPCAPSPPLTRLGREESVVRCGVAKMYTSPPRPPFPPEGGPKGLNFSRWKATQPFPPVPWVRRLGQGVSGRAW
jgi:hypothetical protein